MIIGIGCDIVEISRLAHRQEGLAKKILTVKEYQLYLSYRKSRQLEFLAGRFAAKEAIIKALNEPKLLSDIEVLNNECGKPVCKLNDYTIHISIAHETNLAIAYAICEK